MNNQKLFSIAIPTRYRIDTLEGFLKSIVEIADDTVEIISDNSEDDETSKFIQTIEGSGMGIYG